MSTPTVSHFTTADAKFLDSLKITSEQRVFLERLWDKIPSDKKESSKGPTDIILRLITPAALLFTALAIWNHAFAPLANLAVVGYILLNILTSLLMMVMFFVAVWSDSKAKESKEYKLLFVNRSWIWYLSRKVTAKILLLRFVDWAVIVTTIAAGYLFTGVFLLLSRLLILVILFAMRIPVLRTLDEGVASMFGSGKADYVKLEPVV